ncbi:MAG: response regulator [Hyphomicrobiales bacterium]|nr:response regulator [Hyphomicrobiales bacterium]
MLAASVAIVGMIAAALAATGSPETVVFAVLAILAVGGVFLIFGALSGHITLSERAAAGDFGSAVLADADTAVQVVRNGAVLYANPATERLLAPGQTMEHAFAGDPLAAEALYRLATAAASGRHHHEDVRLRAQRGEEPRWIRIEARPFRAPIHLAAEGPATVWTARDVSADRRREAETAARLVERLAFYDNLPVGMLTVSGEGQIVHLNGVVSRWLGLDADAQRSRPALKDVFAGDAGVQLLNQARAEPGTQSATAVALDLIRDDGAAMPVDVIALPAPVGDETAMIVVDRRSAAMAGAAATAVAATREPLSRALQSAPFGMALIGRDRRILSTNSAFARLFPLRADCPDTIEARVLGEADADSRKAVLAHVERALAGRVIAAPVEVSAGPEAHLARRLYAHPIAGASGDGPSAVLFVLDASEQRALERKFAQSQKMEAVGQLAGGIAHDFNNVLTVIIGLSDMLLQGRRVSDPAHADIMQIKQHANHAAGLVKQLLAFSRKQTLAPTVLALNDVIQDFGYALNKYVGEKVDVKHVAGRDLWQVKADRVQLEQVLINLTVNARDAMPTGGRLTVRTRNVSERESMRLANLSVAPGEYVMIEVEDTGTGMPPEIAARIFEPFFTTKKVGQGTGFGLSTVYGIIKQTGGYIFVDSTVGKGTTFRIYLPRHIPDPAGEAEEAKPVKKSEPARDLTGTGRVLLVEDEEGVRSFGARALQRQGYEVLEAATGVEALEVMERERGRVDLVVSDVIMPEMDGPTMFNEMRRTNPGIKVIFVSGYPSDAFEKSLDPHADFAFLQKPFTLYQLAAAVKEHLGR